MSTALYRRYRPETFSDVIGQEHVTEPLMTAISKNRVNHAYLFSGPRGCGKTTSARILARCLNCAQGPTPIPCGVCDSCVELARNGSGSLDVIEIDAASHGGVDDARDLRERATFAPVRDRFKIFIIDEAHMVTSAGFNALLKIVEEPPEHIKFIFATTEPDKVIGTIRSRTHHYPFRLVPPEPLMAYLELLCNQENIAVAPGVLSLVVRAGGGSVRDSLSVLDQLMAGAGPSGLDYELAVSLLGYTHASLLDDVVDAIAADDSATVFGAVDRVIQTGHDPRRFVEDLLERFRDLIIVNAVPDAAASILRGVPEDQLNRMRTQAQQLGRAELSRAADITNTALTEMTGATSPRLHLELLCARILLPAADQSEQGTLARVDRIERRLSYASGLDAVAPAPVPAVAPAPVPPAQPARHHQEEEPAPAEKLQRAAEPAQEPGAADWGGGWSLPAEKPAAQQRPDQGAQRPGENAQRPEQNAQRPGENAQRPDENAQRRGQTQRPGQGFPGQEPQSHQQGPSQSEPSRPSQDPAAPRQAEQPQSRPVPPQGNTAKPVEPAAPQGTGQIEMIRRAWPEVMDELARIKRSTWLNVNTDAKPRSFNGNQLTLAFASQGNALGFQRGQHMDNLKQAINKVLGLTCSIEAIHDGAAAAGEPDPKVPTSRPNPADGTGSTRPGPAAVSPASAAALPAPASADAHAVSTPSAAASIDEAWGLPRQSAAVQGGPAQALAQPMTSAPAQPAQAPAQPATPAPAQPATPRPAQPVTHRPAQPAATEWTPAGAVEPPYDPEDPGPEEPPYEDEPPARPSRYQQLLDEAARAEAARPKPTPGPVDLNLVEDIPSADDETIEESGLVGRQAIERILNGRLIEERSLDS
ncbi:DNA polymerase III subunit gamma and tau [Arthrobacter sp. JZ12]|uniref:DNA polymerase III subunit gamma and tau n=1 Tax=Arthrobacter sp. JZ12 TaxID=2654190 RepID=UPI002B471260|nr:DNA polymerase III subunit gamma and tau [Arthrobacter sp. JZ12]WRH23929.1 DNA polymerase III subunit gamma and tau [Arthrobacter sp. JZ12]